MNTLLTLALPAAGEAAPDGPSFLNTTQIQGLLVFFVSLVLAVVAIKMFAKADSGDVKGAANSTIVVLLGAVVFGLSVTAAWYSFGTGAVSTLLNFG